MSVLSAFHPSAPGILRPETYFLTAVPKHPKHLEGLAQVSQMCSTHGLCRSDQPESHGQENESHCVIDSSGFLKGKRHCIRTFAGLCLQVGERLQRSRHLNAYCELYAVQLELSSF